MNRNFIFISKIALFVSTVSLLMSSCGTSATNENNDTVETTKLDTAVQNKSVKNVFYSIPSPIELTQLIQRAGATYDKDLMNDINNVSKYTTTVQQGLNLGVYGADLSITSMFDKTQESLFYMKCTSSMAKSLGITTAFNGNDMGRMDANKDNRDSLLNIITDSYYETDDYLKENQRANISALVIAGGWIEALYIGTQIGVRTNNDEIKTRIAEMKGSLVNLCGLLSLYKGEDGIDPVLAKLQDLRKVYDTVIPASSNVNVSTDEKTKVTTIGGGNKLVLTKEQFESIAKKAQEIRSSIVKP